MQQSARDGFTDFDRTGLSIERPFYVIDVYNAGDQFLFVYLDEGKDDPIVYEAVLEVNPYSDRPWIHPLGKVLSAFLNFRLKKLLSGYNPF